VCALLPKVRSMRGRSSPVGHISSIGRCFFTWNFAILGATAAVVSHYLLVSFLFSTSGCLARVTVRSRERRRFFLSEGIAGRVYSNLLFQKI
jgi:hypothetical protein